MDIYVIIRPLSSCEEGWLGWEGRWGEGRRMLFFFCSSFLIYLFLNVISEMDFVTNGDPGSGTQPPQEGPP